MPSHLVAHRPASRKVQAVSTAKAVGLALVIWGLVYPALLWGMGALRRDRAHRGSATTGRRGD